MKYGVEAMIVIQGQSTVKMLLYDLTVFRLDQLWIIP